MGSLKNTLESVTTGWHTFREFGANPPKYLSRLAVEHGPVAPFNLITYQAHLVAEPALIQEVLVKRATEFPKEQRDIDILSRFIGYGLVTVNGEEHRRQRKMAQPAFHTKRIGAYGEVMVDYAAEIMDEWSADEVHDMADEMEKLTMYIVTKTLFDVNKAEMAAQASQIGHAIKELQLLSNAEFTSLLQLPDWLPTRHNRSHKANREILDGIIQQLIDERLAEKTVQGTIPDRGDLLSMFLLAQYEDGSELTPEEVRDQLVTIFVAGHETTSNALTWTWYFLAQHPEVEAQLHAELDRVLNGRLPTLADLRQLTYTEQVLKESMRLQPPVWGLNARTPLADTTIGNYPVKKGDLIFISPYAMHHNPRFFPQPERFDPDRFLPENEALLPRYAYMPFGGGPRVCIGNNFAMMEAVLILATLAQRYRFTLEPNQTIEPLHLVTTSPKHGMQMRAVARGTTPATAAAQPALATT